MINSRQATSARVLPLPAHLPSTTKCWQIDLPDDPEYMALFMGAVSYLAYWFNYERDSTHRARLITPIWKAVLASIGPCITCPDNGCGDCGDDMCQIRQDPMNPCHVQQFCAGSWVTIIDLSLCTPNPAPGGGLPPPHAGGCKDEVVVFFAN